MSLTNRLAKKLPERLLIPSNQLRILNNQAIGQGLYIACAAYTVFMCCTAGEFGVVYKARLTKKYGLAKPQAVAVKTLRGKSLETLTNS